MKTEAIQRNSIRSSPLRNMATALALKLLLAGPIIGCGREVTHENDDGVTQNASSATGERNRPIDLEEAKEFVNRLLNNEFKGEVSKIGRNNLERLLAAINLDSELELIIWRAPREVRDEETSRISINNGPMYIGHQYDVTTLVYKVMDIAKELDHSTINMADVTNGCMLLREEGILIYDQKETWKNNLLDIARAIHENGLPLASEAIRIGKTNALPSMNISALSQALKLFGSEKVGKAAELGLLDVEPTQYQNAIGLLDQFSEETIRSALSYVSTSRFGGTYNYNIVTGYCDLLKIYGGAESIRLARRLGYTDDGEIITAAKAVHEFGFERFSRAVRNGFPPIYTRGMAARETLRNIIGSLRQEDHPVTQ